MIPMIAQESTLFRVVAVAAFCKQFLCRCVSSARSTMEIIKLKEANGTDLTPRLALSIMVWRSERSEIRECIPQEVILKSLVALRKGGVIAVPTDTIYGVAVLAQNIEAMKKVYQLKGRNPNKPIAISVADVEEVKRWGISPVSSSLLHDLLPGPVTVVLERCPDLNPELNSFTNLVGIRVPNHAFIRSLARAAGEPLALTSANVSSSKSTLCIEEFKSLWPDLDLIIDGGTLSDSEESRAGSTVVDLSQEGSYSIIRPGSAEVSTENVLKNKYGLVRR